MFWHALMKGTRHPLQFFKTLKGYILVLGAICNLVFVLGGQIKSRDTLPKNANNANCPPLDSVIGGGVIRARLNTSLRYTEIAHVHNLKRTGITAHHGATLSIGDLHVLGPASGQGGSVLPQRGQAADGAGAEAGIPRRRRREQRIHAEPGGMLISSTFSLLKGVCAGFC